MFTVYLLMDSTWISDLNSSIFWREVVCFYTYSSAQLLVSLIYVEYVELSPFHTVDYTVFMFVFFHFPQRANPFMLHTSGTFHTSLTKMSMFI